MGIVYGVQGHKPLHLPRPSPSKPLLFSLFVLFLSWLALRMPLPSVIRPLLRSRSPLLLTKRTMSRTTWDPKQTPYPQARRDEAYTQVFKSKAKGEVEVKDPYRWLHEPPSQSQETKAAFTNAYLARNPDAEKLKNAIRQNWSYARASCPSLKSDGYYYFNYNSGLQPNPPSTASTPPPSPPLPPQTPPPAPAPTPPSTSTPTSSAPTGPPPSPPWDWSDSGEFIVYSVSRSGSDWRTGYVRRSRESHGKGAEEGGQRGTDPGREDDVIRWLKFSGFTWLKDNSGFFYQRFAAREGHGKDTDDSAGTETDSDVNAMLYFHKLGTKQEEDVLVIKDPENPTYMWGTSLTHDGRFLSLTTSKDTGRSNRLWIADLSSLPKTKDGAVDVKTAMGDGGEGMEWRKVVDTWGEDFGTVSSDGDRIYVLTNQNAPKSKVVTYDWTKPEQGFKDLVPEDPEAILETFHPINKKHVVVGYSRDVKDELYLYELATGKRIKRIGEELLGTVGQVTGKRHHDHFFFSMSSFLSPGTIYQYRFDQPEGKELSTFRTTKLAGLDAKDFVEEQVFYESKDGTRIPMFIVHRKDLKKDGTAPALQYGYGGFSISIAPFFSPSVMTFVSHYGAVLAVPNIRGGGEYGEEWHQAGCHEKKQNVFDDFQAATKYLVSHRYASPEKVTISGGSNGGLLVAACINQAPEMYGAAVADVGVMDMLRFHTWTIGRAWTADYGCADDPEAFDYLYAYSPLHNVNPNAVYPATMLLTADHDDRVVPAHSFKLAAELQHRLASNPNPLLLRLDLKSGHGAGKSTEQRIVEAAEKYGFVAQSLGLQWRD